MPAYAQLITYAQSSCNASLMSPSGVNSVERSPNRADYVKNRFFTRVFEGGGGEQRGFGADWTGFKGRTYFGRGYQGKWTTWVPAMTHANFLCAVFLALSSESVTPLSKAADRSTENWRITWHLLDLPALPFYLHFLFLSCQKVVNHLWFHLHSSHFLLTDQVKSANALFDFSYLIHAHFRKK